MQTSTPYQLGVLLLIYGCFVAKPGAPCGTDKHGSEAEATAAVAAADRAIERRNEEAEEVKDEAFRSPTSALELGPLVPIQATTGPNALGVDGVRENGAYYTTSLTSCMVGSDWRTHPIHLFYTRRLRACRRSDGGDGGERGGGG